MLFILFFDYFFFLILFSLCCFWFLLYFRYKPSIILYTLGSGLNAKQWAAVTIHSGWIREAPHLCSQCPLLLDISIMACQGQEWGIASFPPSTRGKGGLLPHSVKQIFLNTIYWQQCSPALLSCLLFLLLFQRNFAENTRELCKATVILALGTNVFVQRKESKFSFAFASVSNGVLYDETFTYMEPIAPLQPGEANKK